MSKTESRRVSEIKTQMWLVHDTVKYYLLLFNTYRYMCILLKLPCYRNSTVSQLHYIQLTNQSISKI